MPCVSFRALKKKANLICGVSSVPSPWKQLVLQGLAYSRPLSQWTEEYSKIPLSLMGLEKIQLFSQKARCWRRVLAWVNLSSIAKLMRPALPRCATSKFEGFFGFTSVAVRKGVLFLWMILVWTILVFHHASAFQNYIAKFRKFNF